MSVKSVHCILNLSQMAQERQIDTVGSGYPFTEPAVKPETM